MCKGFQTSEWLQVKDSALRAKLFSDASAIMDNCGTRGQGRAMLDAEVQHQLQMLFQRYEGVPEAAVFVDLLRKTYAPRAGAGSCLILICYLRLSYF